MLHKSSPLDGSRLDVIALSLQPVEGEHVRAHMLLCVLDPATDGPPDALPLPEQPLVLRGIAVNAPAGLVARALRGYRLAPAAAVPDDAADTEVEAEQPFAIVLRARAVAAGAGWPDEAVHFEHFSNTLEIDTTSSFEIALARSAMTLRVPAGRTILEVLRENGIDLPSSCEQGACGTCAATVIGGGPDHQDVYPSDGKRARGTRILTCVSRARSARLVLDIRRGRR